MQLHLELRDFRVNFRMFCEYPGTCDHSLLTLLMDTQDISSLPAHDNPLFNLLIQSLKDENPQIRASAKAYIAYSMIKDTNESYSRLLFAFLYPQTNEETSDTFLYFVKSCSQLVEKDFILLCQAISVCPISTLTLKKFKFHEMAGLTAQRLPQLFRSLHQLSSLSLTDMNFSYFYYAESSWEIICDIISSLPNLSELRWIDSNGGLSVENWERLGDTFASLPKLSKFTFTKRSSSHHVTFDNYQWTAFCQALAKATHLVSLDVMGTDLVLYSSNTLQETLFNWSTFSWAPFCSALSSLQHLESLNLSNCELHKLGTIDWQSLAKLSQLSSLYLQNNSLGKNFEAWKGLCDALTSLPRLSLLDLADNYFIALSNDGCPKPFIPVLTSLKYLSLPWKAVERGTFNLDILKPNSWEPKNFTILFQGIQKSNLKSLSSHSFYLKTLDDSSFDHFLQAIVDTKDLTTLDLSTHPYRTGSQNYVRIDQDRFKKFWEAIIRATHLTTLNLSGNNFSHELMPILIEGITKAKHLTTIDLSSAFELTALEWLLFWNTFNQSSQHIHSLKLNHGNFIKRDEETWAAFVQGLTEAKHLRSFTFMHDPLNKNENELFTSALEGLNLLEIISNNGLYPRVVELLKRNCLANINSLTSLLNSGEGMKNANELRHAIKRATIALDKVMYTDTRSALDALDFASAKWFAKNNEPQQAFEDYMQISPLSKFFQTARENAFTIAFQQYRNDEHSSLQAFQHALPICIHEDRLISFSSEFQRTFDGFLLEAIGLTQTLHILSNVTPPLRLKLFQYLSLLILKEQLENSKTTTQTKFFHNRQIQFYCADKLTGLKPLKSLEELETVNVELLFWKSAKLINGTSLGSEEFGSFKLLCQIIEQHEVTLEVTESEGLLA